MTNEEAINCLRLDIEMAKFDPITGNRRCLFGDEKELVEAQEIAIKALERKPRKGHWLRMSDLSEQEDDRYKCSYCGNVVHHTNKMNLYTFNSWCGRCGSDNGRKRGQE